MRENNMETVSTQVGEATAYVNQMMQECMQMGANDFEAGAFNQLLAGLENGSITSEDARKQAYAIRHGKQDYH